MTTTPMDLILLGMPSDVHARKAFIQELEEKHAFLGDLLHRLRDIPARVQASPTPRVPVPEAPAIADARRRPAKDGLPKKEFMGLANAIREFLKGKGDHFYLPADIAAGIKEQFGVTTSTGKRWNRFCGKVKATLNAHSRPDNLKNSIYQYFDKKENTAGELIYGYFKRSDER